MICERVLGSHNIHSRPAVLVSFFFLCVCVYSILRVPSFMVSFDSNELTTCYLLLYTHLHLILFIMLAGGICGDCYSMLFQLL